MEYSILCSNQARYVRIIVNDVPKIIDVQNISTQSVIFPTDNFNIPIDFHGPVPYLPIRYPTKEDMETCEHLDIPPNELWDPSHIGIISTSISNDPYYDTYSHNNDIFNCDIYKRIEKEVNISGYFRTPTRGAFIPSY